MLAVLRGIATSVTAEDAVEKADVIISHLSRYLAYFGITLQQQRAALGDAMLV